MHIVLTTPTGQIGGHILAQLATVPGLRLTLIARRPEALAAYQQQKNIEVVAGSLDQDGVLARAIEQADALFWCVPPESRFATIQARYQGLAALAAEALRNSAVRRVVTVSSGGKGRTRKAGFISALHEMEDVLNATGVAMRHLRNGNFMENYLQLVPALAYQGKFGYPASAHLKVPTVSARDIAAVGAGWLSVADWQGQEGVGVHGPRDLSYAEAAEVFSAALGKPITYEPVTDEAFAATLRQHGGTDDLVENLLDLFHAAETGLFAAEPRTAASTTPTTLEAFSREVLLPAYQQVNKG